MRAKALLITTLCLFGAAVTLPGVSLAQNRPVDRIQGGKNPVIAKLKPCCEDPESGASGMVVRRSLIYNRVLWGDRFEGTVKLPMPNPYLGLPNVEAAAAAELSLILSRGDTPYAECFLEFDGIGKTDEGLEAEAEYKVTMRLQMWRGVPVLQAREGTCDIDLEADGMQTGVPNVQTGDVVTAIVVAADPDSDILFLEGRFRGRHFRWGRY